jgi:hypothetical protein
LGLANRATITTREVAEGLIAAGRGAKAAGYHLKLLIKDGILKPKGGKGNRGQYNVIAARVKGAK